MNPKALFLLFAMAALLCGCAARPVGNQIALPLVRSIQTNYGPPYYFVLDVNLIVDGTPISFQRLGKCVIAQVVADGVPLKPNWTFSPSYVAWTSSDGEAVLFPVPNVCPAEQLTVGSPLVQPVASGLPVFWLPDLKEIAYAEYYPPVQRADDAPIHARIVSMSVHAAAVGEAQPPSGQDDSFGYKAGFLFEGNSSSVVGKKYQSMSIYVLPKSFWSRSPSLSGYFSKHPESALITPSDQDPERKVALQAVRDLDPRKSAQVGARAWGGPWGADTMPYYLYPVTPKDQAWIVDLRERGIARFERSNGRFAGQVPSKAEYRGVTLPAWSLYYDASDETLAISTLTFREFPYLNIYDSAQ